MLIDLAAIVVDSIELRLRSAEELQVSARASRAVGRRIAALNPREGRRAIEPPSFGLRSSRRPSGQPTITHHCRRVRATGDDDGADDECDNDGADDECDNDGADDTDATGRQAAVHHVHGA